MCKTTDYREKRILFGALKYDAVPNDEVSRVVAHGDDVAVHEEIIFILFFFCFFFITKKNLFC